jgi:hypothetical protein
MAFRSIMNKSFTIAIAGEIYVDQIFTGFDHIPLLGEEVFAEQYRREAGGGTVNTACALDSGTTLLFLGCLVKMKRRGFGRGSSPLGWLPIGPAHPSCRMVLR